MFNVGPSRGRQIAPANFLNISDGRIIPSNCVLLFDSFVRSRFSHIQLHLLEAGLKQVVEKSTQFSRRLCGACKHKQTKDVRVCQVCVFEIAVAFSRAEVLA